MKQMGKSREVTKGGRGFLYGSTKAGISAVLFIILALLLPHAVNAAVFNVSAGDVTGLINAITAANGSPGPNTINLAASTYTLTVVNNTTDGANGLPDITGEIIINGNGSIVERSSAAPSLRVFHVASTGKLTLNALTVRNGMADSGYGGGLYNSGIVTVSNSVITNNSATTSGGGETTSIPSYGGGIYNIGTVTVSNSIISNNSVMGSGVKAPARGGGISNSGTVTVSNSTISNNSAIGGSGGVRGGIGYGGGIDNVFGTVTISNSTIATNSANSGSGFEPSFGSYGGGISNSGTVMVSNSIISNNFANPGFGGGISGIYNGGTMKLSNSIVANQLAGLDCGGAITSLGYNLDSDGSCNLTAVGDKSNDKNANLGPLQDNGGPTQTMALLSGSDAIDAGDPTGCKDPFGNLLTTDQRGFVRPVDGGSGTARCDIGAYEFNATPTVSAYSIWNSIATPTYQSVNDPHAVELGVKFRSDVNGYITALRFYKGATNTGNHIGNLWTSTGTLLASATFNNETASGWQQVNLPAPVAIDANTTYVASYHTNTGNYAWDGGSFTISGVYNPPLRALQDGADGPNGVYKYGSSSSFPDQAGGNYWVDVVFTTTAPPDTTAPTVTAVSPTNGATDVSTGTTVTVTFSEAMNPATISTSTIYLQDPSNAVVPAMVIYNTTTWTATLTPTNPLANSTPYTVTVKGGSGGVTDGAGNPLLGNYTSSFTTASATTGSQSSIWNSTATPTYTSVNDPNAVELGMKFRSDVDGLITGLRFYKGAGNTGTHIGNLWTSTGTLLASVTFTNETASGWQQVALQTPVAINANTTYVASYHTNTGHYAWDGGSFTTSGVYTPPLRALQNGADGPNGVYKYGSSSSFPDQAGANYWVDVVFTTTAPQDTTPPQRFSGSPTGSLAKGTTSVTLSISTDEAATCRYSTTADTSFDSMTNTFSTTGSTTHSTGLTGLTDGSTYAYYVKCKDTAGNANTDDFLISFSIATGPVAYWTFDEGTGTTARDISGYGHDGTLMNGPAWVPGKIGTALQFNGVNQYVSAPNHSDFAITGELTLSAWIKTTADTTGTDQGIIWKGDDTVAAPNWGNLYRLAVKDNKANFLVVGSDNTVYKSNSVSNINDGNWHHLAGVFSKRYTPYYLFLYVDGGNPVATVPMSGQQLKTSNQPISIGSEYPNYAGYFNGAVDDVRIYQRALSGQEISDIHNTADITHITRWGTQWGSYGAGNGQFNFPRGVAADSAGNVYVADAANNRIQKFTASGAYITQWGSYGSGNGQFHDPNGVAVDSAGNVYVADSNNQRIQKFAADGTYISQIGSAGSGNGQLYYPEGVAVDTVGNVYVADSNNQRIQKFTSTGSYITQWGATGPIGMAVDSSGNVYVADAGNNRIQKFSSDGTYITQWGMYGSGNGQFINPFGIAVDSSGDVYVSDTYNNRIQKFTSDGTYITQWGMYGSGNGQFINPFGIAVDSSGNVYVADPNNCRIQKFAPVFSIWSNTATPAYTSVNDPNAVELGVKFRSDVNGFITGLRFYKGPGNAGTHIGNLWSSTGTLLASATFNNETASGWQQVNFATPVAINANTTYVASYHTNTGHYAWDGGAFTNSSVYNPPLRALQDGTDGPNGVYLYGAGGFPTQTYGSANYWVDVVFQK